MTDHRLDRRQMLKGAGALGAVGALAALHGPTPARAEGDEGVINESNDGFVGSWLLFASGVPGQPPGGAPNLNTFLSDGTIIDASRPVQPAPSSAPFKLIFSSAGHGAWVPTGKRTCAVTFTVLTTDENANYIGRRTINATQQLSADGQTFTGSATVTITNPAGTVVASFHVTTQATRITVQPPG